MTRNDLVNGNADLLAKAGQMLGTLPKVGLEAQVGQAIAGKRKVTIVTQGLDRVDVHVDGRPRATVDVVNGTVVVEVPDPGIGGHDVAARGFRKGQLEAVAHVDV